VKQLHIFEGRVQPMRSITMVRPELYCSDIW